MVTESKRLVILALLANAGIAVTKFVAAGISGSSAMLAEAFHSVADSGNQLFLLRGHAASRYAADVRHPFGRGKEMYFWSFMVAVFLFVGGSVLSLVNGFNRFLHPEAHGDVALLFSLAVLGIAALFEILVAFRPAIKQFNEARAGRRLWPTIREGRDPSLLIVVFEDSAAVVGLAIAAVGLILADLTGNARWDGLASMIIGLLLAAVAWVIAVEMKAMLIGESATREVRAMILAATLSVGEVHHVDRLLTMQMAPHEILVNMDVVFDDGLSVEEVEDVIARTESAILGAVPTASRVFIEPVNA
jgi:cation diffusion facilitator family transporter